MLAIRENALGPNHPDVASSMNYIAVVYDNQNECAKAEPLHKRSLDILEKTHGPNHPDVAVARRNVTDSHPSTGEA